MIYRSSITPIAIIAIQDAQTLFYILIRLISSDITINVTPSNVVTVTFRPNKIITSDNDVVYSVCDNGSSNEMLKQVKVIKKMCQY